MGYLLDTHTILWVLENDNKLSSNARQVIEDIQKDCFVSIASLFEIAIKRKIGKLELSQNIETYTIEIVRIGIKILPISPAHLEAYDQIPMNLEHRDPFDRLLIATAFAENLIVITDDHKFKWYNYFVQILW